MKDILFVLSGNDLSPTARVYNYLPFLQKANVSYRLLTPPRRMKAQFYLWIPWCVRLMIWGLRARSIFVQKDIFLVCFWRFFKLCGKRIVYDFDDAVFVDAGKNRSHVAHLSLFKGKGSSARVVGRMISLCDATLVANEYLASFARRHSAKTRLMPMSVRVREFTTKLHSDHEPLIIGWHGSPGTCQYLSLIEEPLAALAEAYGERIRILFMTNGDVPFKKVPFSQVPWTQETEIPVISSFDIGLVPLRGDPFSLGKCSYKLIQYLAAGLPTVSSNVGFHKDTVTDGVNGYLADSTQAWVSKIRQLMEDCHLRERVGRAARQTAEEQFEIQRNAQSLIEAVLPKPASDTLSQRFSPKGVQPRIDTDSHG